MARLPFHIKVDSNKDVSVYGSLKHDARARCYVIITASVHSTIVVWPYLMHGFSILQTTRYGRPQLLSMLLLVRIPVVSYSWCDEYTSNVMLNVCEHRSSCCVSFTHVVCTHMPMCVHTHTLQFQSNTIMLYIVAIDHACDIHKL